MMRMSAENLVLVFLGVLALVRGIYIVNDECPPNEEYLLCGSACSANCSNLNSTVTCTDDCVEGCFCIAGFVRDDNGTCVTSDQCGTLTCPNNQEYTECGPACNFTCSAPKDQICTLQCVRGCFCKPPLILNDKTGFCIKEEDCPADPCLNENEVYDSCTGGCEPSCSDPVPFCNMMCSGGCVCAPGLLRNETGDCVSVNECPANGTDVTLLSKYLAAINNILHL